MKKILRPIAAIVLLCAMVFLGGEWPEGTPRKKVVTADSIAIGIVAACGFYLRRTEDK